MWNFIFYYIFKIINYGCYYGQRTHVHKHTQTGVRVTDVWCEVISPYVNRKSRGKTRYREDILCLNAKLCLSFSLSCSYFLFFAPLKAPTLHLHLSSAACCCAFVRVGGTMWVCTCQLGAHIHDPGLALGKDDTDQFCFHATTIYRQGRRRMNAGCRLAWKDGSSCKE